ncbi:MAG: DUF5994 family protein [Mycobacterium sp.]
MVDAVAEHPSATRLAVCGRTEQRGTVDGAWWPPEYNLKTTLPDLISVMGRWLGPVHRVLYDPSLFPSAPSRVIRGSSVISVDRYSLVARDTIFVIGTHTRNALLYVVPPETDAERARELLKTVSGAAQPMTVRMLRAIVNGQPSTHERMG